MRNGSFSPHLLPNHSADDAPDLYVKKRAATLLGKSITERKLGLGV